MSGKILKLKPGQLWALDDGTTVRNLCGFKVTVQVDTHCHVKSTEPEVCTCGRIDACSECYKSWREAVENE
jgi:hypothetical protein